jgi:uncharacterized protein (DUF3820 family)
MDPSILHKISFAATNVVAAIASQKPECAMQSAIQILALCEEEGAKTRKRRKTCTAVEDNEATDTQDEQQDMLEAQEREQSEKTTLIEDGDKAGLFVIPFGKFKGVTINKTPSDYLCWLMGMKREGGKYLPGPVDKISWVRSNHYETLSHVKKYLTWRCWECGSRDVRFRHAHLCTNCWHQCRR